MIRLVFFGFLISQIIFSQANAQNVVVESTKINEEKIEPSRSSTIITAENIKTQNSATVANILAKVPGLTVVKQGGVGQTTSVFIRGARSEDTLVLIDSMEANDAMSPGGGFDFSSMTLENIERIEVYRGPQSVRFGGGALGGVINIITKEGANKPTIAYLTETGSYKTNRQAISTNGKIDNLGYSFGVDRYSTGGFSAASEKYGATEEDGAEVQSASGKLSWAVSKTAKMLATVRFTNTDVSIDTFGGPGGDDPNNKNKSKQLVTGISGSERFFEDRLKSTLGIYYSEIDRQGRNKPDAESLTDSIDRFLSENRKIQSENDFSFGENSTIRFSLQWRDESGHGDTILNGSPKNIDRKSQHTFGTSLTYLYDSETWFFDLGMRMDQSSTVSSISSFRSSLGRKLYGTNTKIYLSYGTGYKLPTLYQLYSEYGNQNLKYEDAATVEATIVQEIAKGSSLTITTFENRYKNYIDWDPNPSPGRYYNISNAKTRGFEVQVSSKVSEEIELSGNYTYLEANDETTGLKLLRRPQNTWTLTANYQISSMDFVGHYIYRGERDDYDPDTFERISVPAYDLFSFGVSYEIKKYFKVFARIENAFDKKYEEVAGYGTAGRALYAGLSGDF